MRDGNKVFQRLLSAVAVAVLICAAATRAHGQCDLYVRAGAVPPDADPGTTPATAFGSIKAAAAALRNGDVLCVGPGRYEEGNIDIPDGAAPSVPVVVRADTTGISTGDPPGDVELVPPPASPSITTGFLVRGRRYVIIEGFAISGFSDACIQVRAHSTAGTPSRDITIRGNTATRCGKGIDVFESRDRIVIERNTVLGNSGTGISLEACLFENPNGRCRFSSGAPISPVVSNNRVAGNSGVGIAVNEATDALVQNNLIYSNDGAGIALQDALDTQVVNNLVYGNEKQGLSVGKLIASPGTLVLNNTFYANGNWGIEIGTPTAGSPGSAVVNNIVWRNDIGRKGIGVLNEESGLPEQQVRPASICGYLAGFNLVPDEYGPKTPHNVYDQNREPLFVNPMGADGILGGEGAGLSFTDRSDDDNFRLRQLDGEEVSPGVNGGSTAVDELGLTGSTADNGRPDSGKVDVGFHYDADPQQLLSYVPPFMPVYVRKHGTESGPGFTPTTAFSTIGAGAVRARAGVTVVVGPGRYSECSLHPVDHQGLATFLADPSGSQTGDMPGAVVVDAAHCADSREVHGFNIIGACGAVVDGFHVTGARQHGIRVDDFSDGAVVRNNVVFDNGRHGIAIINSSDVRVTNNLAFANGTTQVGGGGISIGSSAVDGPTAPGSRRAILEFNTAYYNAFNGIQVGDGTGVSSHAGLRYNVTGENGKLGFEVGDDQRRADNLRGLEADYNLFEDGVGVGVEIGDRGTGNLIDIDPGYIDPTAVSTGDWTTDQHFRLRQSAAGQQGPSRVVDYGDITALVAGMAERSTRSDGAADTDSVDLGYHYPLVTDYSLVGDCDGDGAVRINEIILAVNITLGSMPMSSCMAIDADGDGASGISELVRAVGNSLRG